MSSPNKERPILFSGAMVRAVIEGRKTQTRRVVTPQPAPNAPHDGGTSWVYRPNEGLHVPCGTVGHLTVAEKMGLRCPYGQPGDRLWVRETWRAWALTGAGDLWRVEYAADGATRVLYPPPDWMCPRVLTREPLPWAPSIHMPRWACRLVLEVVSVRVERLQDISEADALAEGVERHPQPFTRGWRNYEPEPAFESVSYHPSARESFASLWRSINGPNSWDANPWVWVVEFRKVEGA